MLQLLRKRLEMSARAAAPAVLKRLVRIMKAGLKKSPPSQPLPDELVTECRLCGSRYTLLDRLPAGGDVIEVGTLHGDFAAEILLRCSPASLHLVDVDLSRLRSDVASHPAIVRHETLTSIAATRFEDAAFDWVYIDAGHDYASVRADAAVYSKKVKPGGYLVFNDFAHIDIDLGQYGVHRAVVDFCLENRWPLAFLALDGAGLYDVALRSPCTSQIRQR